MAPAGRQWIIVTPLAKNAIGDPCAGKRWQDHHLGVVVFYLYCYNYYFEEVL